MFGKVFENEWNLAALLTLAVLSMLGVVLIVAGMPSDAYLRLSLYLFWRFFFENSLLALVVIGSVLVLLFVSSLLCRRVTVDSFLFVFSFGFAVLFIFMLALNTLNLGLSVLSYPLTIHPIPPLAVHNPLFGFLALVLALSKGLLLEEATLQSSSKIEKLCLIIGLGFGFTSFQVAILSYLKILYPSALICSDTALFAILLIIFVMKRPNLGLPILRSYMNQGVFSTFFSSVTRMTLWQLVMVSAIILLISADSYYSVAAIVEFDSLAYLTYYARIIYHNHGVLDLYGTSIGLEMSAAYPIGFQALGLYFYEYVSAADDFYMRILPPIFFFSFLFATYLLSSQIFKDSESKLLCVFAVSSTLILNYYVALSSHYTTYLAFLTTLNLSFLVKYLKMRDPKLLYLSGIFGGLASLVNYLGLSTIVFLCIAAIVGRAKPVAPYLKAFLINGLIPSVYLFRNLFLTGDPIYPFLMFSSDPLWSMREQHFYIQSIYAGLQFSSSFSVVDFLTMRSFGARPWPTLCILLAPIFVAHVIRAGKLRTLKIEEKALILLFAAALSCFFIVSTFERYILPMIAVYACFYVWIREKAKEIAMKRLAFALVLVLVYSFSITLGASLGGYKSFNSNAISGDTADYLSYYYADDANCWRWINERTNPEDKIASYEIRYYYIEREIFPLDSQRAAPLYDPNLTIDEALRFLKNHGIEYVLSPGWVSMSKVLPAYRKLVITPFLGNPQYLPAVYAYGSTALYHVGPLDTERLVANFLKEDTIPPMPGINIDLNATLEDGLVTLNFQVPGDYHQRANLTVRVLSNSSSTEVEIWEGVYKKQEGVLKASRVMAQPQRCGNGSEGLNWLLRGGSYVLIVSSSDTNSNPSKVRLSISIGEMVLSAPEIT